MDAFNIFKENMSRMAPVQEYILEFIDQKDNQDENFNKLTSYLNNQNLIKDKRQFTLILHLISEISEYYYRPPNFFDKIERIIRFLSKDIKGFFTNIEIFNFFINCKRLLLFLFEEQIINPDKALFYIITNDQYKKKNYPQYFYPEFHEFLDEKYKSSDPEFEQKRKIGENDEKICQIIRQDSIDEFTSFVNQTEISIISVVKESIYETNSILLKDEVTLFEYAAFFGSEKIFKYIKDSKAEITPIFWLLAIHGQNTEILQMIKEMNISQPEKFKFAYSNNFYRLSKKCQNTNLSDVFNRKLDKDDCIFNLCYYNFANINEIVKNQQKIVNDILQDSQSEFNLFYTLCKYDYLQVVDFFLENLNDEIMSLIILKYFTFLIKFFY